MKFSVQLRMGEGVLSDGPRYSASELVVFRVSRLGCFVEGAERVPGLCFVGCFAAFARSLSFSAMHVEKL